MASLTCTITKAGRSDAYGRPLTVGQTYTSGFDEVKSLVQAGFASVSNPVILDDGFFEVAGNNARFLSKTPFSTVNADTGGLEGFAGSDLVEKQLNPYRKTLARARILTGLNSATASTTAGSTWHLTAAADAKFTHIAPVFQSLETGTITITSCAVAPILGSTAGSLPHSSATYVPVTFSGAASGTMPARVAASVPSFYVGDMTPCKALAADAAGLYWLAIRAYFAGTGYSYRTISAITGLAGSGGQLVGRGWSQLTQNVDGITTPASFTNSTAGTAQVITGFITLNDVGGAVIATFGDSTVAGVGSASGAISGEGLSIYTLSGNSGKYSHMNCGIPGSSPAVYGAFARNTLATLGRYISHAVYRISSINDPCNSQAKLDAHWAEALRFVEACQALGITPILETCTPQNLGSVSADQYRQAINTLARSGDGGEWLVIDIDAAIADTGANSWQYLPAYNSGDNSHPNLAGYQQIDLVAVRPVLNRIL